MVSSEPFVTLAGCDSTTASSSPNPSGGFGGPLLCHRHRVGESFTSGTDENPFRRFIHCPMRKVSGCDYFRWVDEELTPHYLASVQRLKQQKEALETQLQYKTELTKVLYEKIRLKDDELKRLNYGTTPPRETPYAVTRNQMLFVVSCAGLMMIFAVVVKCLLS